MVGGLQPHGSLLIRARAHRPEGNRTRGKGEKNIRIGSGRDIPTTGPEKLFSSECPIHTHGYRQ